MVFSPGKIFDSGIEAKKEEKKIDKLESQSYEFFGKEIERRELFEISESISEYIREQKIPNVIIVDRSSRPLYVGLEEYFKSKYPSEPRPNIYFVNPKGFNSKEELSNKDIDKILLNCEVKGDLKESAKRLRSREDVLKEFQDIYKRLMEDKQKPVLVFDTCIHTGNSLNPVKQALCSVGFSDIRITSVNPEKEGAKVKTDYFVTEQKPSKGCHPFTIDKMIEKTFDHVYSRRAKGKEKRERGIRLRQEIKMIMREFLEKK